MACFWRNPYFTPAPVVIGTTPNIRHIFTLTTVAASSSCGVSDLVNDIEDNPDDLSDLAGKHATIEVQVKPVEPQVFAPAPEGR